MSLQGCRLPPGFLYLADVEGPLLTAPDDLQGHGTGAGAAAGELRAAVVDPVGEVGRGPRPLGLLLDDHGFVVGLGLGDEVYRLPENPLGLLGVFPAEGDLPVHPELGVVPASGVQALEGEDRGVQLHHQPPDLGLPRDEGAVARGQDQGEDDGRLRVRHRNPPGMMRILLGEQFYRKS